MDMLLPPMLLDTWEGVLSGPHGSKTPIGETAGTDWKKTPGQWDQMVLLPTWAFQSQGGREWNCKQR